MENQKKPSARTDTKDHTADETNEEGRDENHSDDDIQQAPCYHIYETFGEELDRVSAQTCCDTIDLEQTTNSEASGDIRSDRISTKRKQVT